jgi:hypothetical protein
MTISNEKQALIEQKLAAFEQLQPVFEESFQFVANVHGLQRFTNFPVVETVHYLHALWICDCKDHLLSVYRNIARYEGAHCLNLLRNWQEQQDTASVIDFLHRKLDMLPLADLTRQIHVARTQHPNDGLAQRLMHGRKILLNRGINLMTALDSIFALPEETLFQQVEVACRQYQHLPEQVALQLAELQSPIYAYSPHQKLAQRNMLVMNSLGVHVMGSDPDQPGKRSWRVLTSTRPLGSYAEHVVDGYQDLTSFLRNNPALMARPPIETNPST